MLGRKLLFHLTVNDGIDKINVAVERHIIRPIFSHKPQFYNRSPLYCLLPERTVNFSGNLNSTPGKFHQLRNRER